MELESRMRPRTRSGPDAFSLAIPPRRVPTEMHSSRALLRCSHHSLPHPHDNRDRAGLLDSAEEVCTRRTRFPHAGQRCRVCVHRTRVRQSPRSPSTWPLSFQSETALSSWPLSHEPAHEGRPSSYQSCRSSRFERFRERAQPRFGHPEILRRFKRARRIGCGARKRALPQLRARNRTRASARARPQLRARLRVSLSIICTNSSTVPGLNSRCGIPSDLARAASESFR